MVKKLQALKAKKGFTLVELIVVIAIIGVLAAILVPTMMNVVTKARVSSSDQTAKSIADSVTQWLSDLEANRGVIKDGYITIVIGADKKATVAADTAGNYTRGGSDSGTLALNLLKDDLDTNYPWKGGEQAVAVIKTKHVLGVAYSDNAAQAAATLATTFTATVFEAGTYTWASASKEGILPSNDIIGTNPKLSHA